MSSRIKVFGVEVYNQAMLKLREQGFRPATAEQVEQGRLDGKLTFDLYYDTATGIFYAGNKQDKFKILPYSSELANITPQTVLWNGGIQRTNEQYNSRRAKEFTRKDGILNQPLTESQALESVFWLVALNNNKALLERLVGHVFKINKDKYRRDTAMGFYLRDVQENPNIRALYLCGLGGGNGADASDNYDLNGDARLVGVREKTGEASAPKIIKPTLQEIRLIKGVRAGKIPLARLDLLIKKYSK